MGFEVKYLRTVAWTQTNFCRAFTGAVSCEEFMAQVIVKRGLELKAAVSPK